MSFLSSILVSFLSGSISLIRSQSVGAASITIVHANQGAKEKAGDRKEQLAAAANDAADGNHSSQYLILFVPINTLEVDNQNQQKDEPMMGLPTYRMLPTIRAPLILGISAESSDDAQSVIPTVADSDDGLSSNNKLSKEHKELLKKFFKLTSFQMGE